MGVKEQLLGIAKDIVTCEQRLEQLKFEFETIMNGSSSVPKSSKKKLAKDVADRVVAKRVLPKRDDTELRVKTLKALKKHGPMTRSTLATEVHSSPGRITRVLEALRREGEVAPGKEQLEMANGHYRTFEVWALA